MANSSVLTFTRTSDSGGSFKVKANEVTFCFDVMRSFENSESGETQEMQEERIKRMIDGEAKVEYATYADCNGESEFRLDKVDDTFILNGGMFGPPFGGDMRLEASYNANADAIDAFLKFMLGEE